jgi:hypothetical protein
VAAGRPTENSELVLDRDHGHVAGIQEVGGAPVRIQIPLLDLKANDVRISETKVTKQQPSDKSWPRVL